MPIYAYECPSGHQFERYVPKFDDPAPECADCGAFGSEKIWKVTRHLGGGTFPFVTTHITGKPVEVTSEAHLQALCKEHGVNPRPDAAWLTKEYVGVDFRTGKQIYKEGSGMGLPGCWFALVGFLLSLGQIFGI